jgi:hypothetical protein
VAKAPVTVVHVTVGGVVPLPRPLGFLVQTRKARLGLFRSEETSCVTTGEVNPALPDSGVGATGAGSPNALSPRAKNCAPAPAACSTVIQAKKNPPKFTTLAIKTNSSGGIRANSTREGASPPGS